MALVTSGQIDLIDLTDSRVAQLNLSTSLPKIQTETGDGFSPDFTIDQGKVINYNNNGFPQNNEREVVGLYIIPSLYFGQELISIKNFYNKIFYYIGNRVYFYEENVDNSNAEIFVNSYGELVYRKNLEEDNLTIVAEIENYDDGVNYYEDIRAQVELVKISSMNFVPLMNYNKNIFTDTDSNDIELTALLYHNGKEYEGEIVYEWIISPEVSGVSLGNEKTQTISRTWINNLATVFCTMTAAGNNYTIQVTITDRTDPLFSQIISSKGLVFTDTNTLTELTCDVYKGANFLNDNITYAWYYYTEGQQDFVEMTDSNDSTKYKTKTIEIIPQAYDEKSVTFRCIATYKEKETTIAQASIAIAPEVKAVFTPTQVFIPATETGSLKEGNSFDVVFNFKLVDSKGNLVEKADKDTLSVAPLISLNEEQENPFIINYDCLTEDFWDYNIIIFFQENEDFTFQDFKDSILFTIEYTYRDTELIEEFYIIKNLKGKSGRGVESIVSQYYLGDSSKTLPEDVEWTEAPPAFSTDMYLWTRSKIIYTDGAIEYTEPVYDAAWNSIDDKITSVQSETYASLDSLEDRILGIVSTEYVGISNYESFSKEISTQFEQTSDSFTMRFDKVENSISTLNETVTQNKYIRFIDGDIYLGEVNNPLILKISKEKISFISSNAEIAYFSSGQLTVNQITAKNSLSIGPYSFVENQMKGISLKYIN